MGPVVPWPHTAVGDCFPATLGHLPAGSLENEGGRGGVGGVRIYVDMAKKVKEEMKMWVAAETVELEEKTANLESAWKTGQQ